MRRVRDHVLDYVTNNPDYEPITWNADDPQKHEIYKRVLDNLGVRHDGGRIYKGKRE